MSLVTPKFLSRAFAENGTKNDIPEQQDPAGPNNRASYETGFPPVTVTPKVAGGKPPMGKDMNGVLYDVSNTARYSQAGMHYPFIDILPRLKSGDSCRVQRGVTASLNHLGGFLLLTTDRMVHFTG